MAGTKSTFHSSISLRDHPALLTPLCARILLGGVFLVAAISKTIAPETLQTSIQTLIGESQATVPASYALILCEAILGMGILVGYHTRLLGLAAAILVMSFMVVYLPDAFGTEPAADCGCFGEFFESKVDELFFIRNTALFALAIYLFNTSENHMSLDRLLREK